MDIKKIIKNSLIAFFVLVVMVFNTSVGAAEEVARLKACLENEHIYKILDLDYLGHWIAANTNTFKANFDGSYVTVEGLIKYSSVSSSGKTVILYGNDTSIEIDTSTASVLGTARSLKLGDTLRVYGRVDSTHIDAEYLLVNPELDLKVNSYVYYPDKVMEDETITDLTKDGHITFKVPVSWKGDFVMGRLTNNDVNGYSFYLNAISPQNLEYPENFYIFYFSYETYLDRPPQSPTRGDRRDIEKLIINNILENLSGDFSPKMAEITVAGGTKLDYTQTIYKPKDGNDYRLEFLFKPDNGGIICMLYLYYPNDNAVNHIREAAYVINTISNK